jgi:hypothetical protein
MLVSPDVSIVENNQTLAVIRVLSSAGNVFPNYAVLETLQIDTNPIEIFFSQSFREISFGVFLIV